MSPIQIFNNPQFGDIRVATDENGNPLFCLLDLCRSLNLTNPSVVAQKLDEEERPKLDLGSRQGETIFVTESGLYTVILRSDSLLAKPMQKWVTSEVLPAIRKHGGYLTPEKLEEVLTNPDTIIRLATDLKTEREKSAALKAKTNEQARALQDAAPKVLFADSVMTSEQSVLIRDLAKILRQNGILIGQNRLFKWLRDNHYLCVWGESYNQPTQSSMELGLFEIKKNVINQPDGTIFVTETTKVSSKGQIYFVNKFLNGANA